MQQFLVLIYNDDTLLEAMPAGEFDRTMQGCFVHADELRAQGKLTQSMQLEASSTGKTVRILNGRTSEVDGPFAETKEILGGFYLIECENLDQALEWAKKVPLQPGGTIEVRPVMDYEQFGLEPAEGKVEAAS